MSSDTTAALPAWQHDPIVFSRFVAELAAGDGAAWQSLYEEWYQRLVRLAAQKAGARLPPDDYEDPASEAIERLSDALQVNPAGFRSSSEMFGWLTTVTRRRTIEAIRRRSGRVHRYQLVPLPEEGTGEIAPMALVQRVQIDVDDAELPCEQVLRDLVQKLSVRDQEIFLKTESDDVLAYRYDVTTQQIADIRYKRARALKRQVERSDEGVAILRGPTPQEGVHNR